MTEAKDPTARKPGKAQAKLFYRLDEVSRLANLDAGTIEGWEEEFSFLQAGQTASGKKIFRQRDLEIILRIKELIDRQGFTLAGAKRKIEAGKRVLSRREGGLGNGVKNPDGERGRFRIVSQTIFPTRNGREPSPS